MTPGIRTPRIMSPGIMSTVRPAVLIAIPAHNEEMLVGRCLRSVIKAAESAQRSNTVGLVRLAVCAHRCHDSTATVARAVLAGAPVVDPVVIELSSPMRVGGVRAELIRRASAGMPTEHTWLFSTDADTEVPVDWITGIIGAATVTGADLVLGLAELLDWEADDAARAAYEEIIAAGLHANGHDHVYAANLAIRLAAYQQIGGFAAVRHGEEHHLAAAARAAGLGVSSVYEPRVRTSARMPGRAEAGLGDLLARLTGSNGRTSRGVKPAIPIAQQPVPQQPVPQQPVPQQPVPQ